MKSVCSSRRWISFSAFSEGLKDEGMDEDVWDWMAGSQVTPSRSNIRAACSVEAEAGVAACWGPLTWLLLLDCCC